MKTINLISIVSALLALCLLSDSCGRNSEGGNQSSIMPSPTVRAHEPIDNTLALVLVPHEGNDTADREIQKFQRLVRSGVNGDAALERLGWAFVAKAHASFDPGFYKLAEACGSIVESNTPGCAEASLLRGHVLQNLHRFAEAEQLARELVAKRGLSYDFGLLGDALMEQGRLAEAVGAYQQMADIRPDLQAYARVAHVRWLTGDLDGAIAMLQAAANASSPNDPDSAAWINSRLASLQLQSGDIDAARRRCAEALALCPDYPPALLLRGKMALAQQDSAAAIANLKQAAQKNPLPEYQWALADALHGAGRDSQAHSIEGLLRRRGMESDPRTLSIYLATRCEDVDVAVRLAEQELNTRADVFTYDALAWALSAAGRHDEARARMQQALAAGTVDSRLLFHATVIASRAGAFEEAKEFFARANLLKELLLPSERSQLLELRHDLASIQAEGEERSRGAVTISASTW
jgi:tetratricopeptide (TPR) repeat protein